MTPLPSDHGRTGRCMTPSKERTRRPKCRRPKDEPEGYLQWHTWAKKKDKTHYVVRCREHDLYHVWLPRTRRDKEGG